MFKFKLSPVTITAVLLFGTVPASVLAQTGPVLFYSDLTDGPRTGGENNKGAYVCVYGRNFGSTRGTSTITVGGVAVDSYPVWSDGIAPSRGDSKACFQLGSSVPTGAQSLQMTVSGAASNTLPFYVRADAADAIYCVSDVGLPVGAGTAPSDRNDGHFGGSGHGCWATVVQAYISISNTAGAILYLHNINTPASINGCFSGYSWCAAVGGADANHMSVIDSYPGAPSTLGSLTLSANSLVGINGVHIEANNYTAANLIIRAASPALVAQGTGQTGIFNWRAIANDMECSSGAGMSACIWTNYINGGMFLGNYIHDVELLMPHGYETGAVPGGGPVDSADSVLLSVTSDGAGAAGSGASTCVATTKNSPGQLYVGEADFGFSGGPGTINASLSYLPPGVGKITSVGANSFTFTCGTTLAGTFNSSNYPQMWYNARNKYQHTSYFGTDSTNYNIGWNEFANNWGNNDLDINSTPQPVANPRNPSADTYATWGVPNPILPTDPAQPGYPVLGSTNGCTSGTCMSSRTYYVSMSWMDAGGHESDASRETAMTLAAGQLLTLTAPPFSISGVQTPAYLSLGSCSTGCTPAQWCVFVGQSAGVGTKQACYAGGVNYTEVASGITSTGSARLDWTTQTIGMLGGYPGTHIAIHDNLIHGGANNAIDANAMSPTPSNVYGDASTGGGVWIYNNVIYDEAKGYFVAPSSGVTGTAAITSFIPSTLGNSAGIAVVAAAQNGPTITGTAYIENNTVYDVGGNMAPLIGTAVVGYISVGQSPGAQCGIRWIANNNVFVSPNAPAVEPLWNPFDFPCAWTLSGQDNLWYNSTAPATAPPAATAANGNSTCVRSLTVQTGTPCLTHNITADPLFVSPTTGDFRLQATSPAKSAGVPSYPLRDFFGVPRGLNGGYSLGAFEIGAVGSTTTTSRSGFDINGDGVVDQNDVAAAISQVLGNCSNADVNHDGVCNILDVQLIANAAASGQ